MKKTLILSTLLAATLFGDAKYDYEFTAVGGYVINENNIGLRNQAAGGAELQFNNLGTTLAPELSLLYSPGEYDNKNSVDIFRATLNGVYEYKKLGFLVPLTKVGVGYETMSTQELGNVDSIIFDAGVGAKIPFSDSFALKLEAIYMPKYNSKRWDSNAVLLAGLNFAFGTSTRDAEAAARAQKEAEAEAKARAEREAAEARAKAEREAAEAKARAEAEAKAKAEREAAEARAKAEAAAAAAALAAANADDDKDGVVNSKDKCPNTPKSVTVVDANGCMKQVNLYITFENASYDVDQTSHANIAKFAQYMKLNPNSEVEIIGFTDSIGSASANKKLSLKRAEAVKSMLVKEGVAAKRITTSGMGEENPVASNMTKEGRAENRRIEAKLTK